MKNPYYARILFEIEGHIFDYDLKVHSTEGVQLKDSDIKSALRKAMGLLKGSGPLTSPKDQHERLKGSLAIELCGIFEHMAKNEGLPRKDFLDSLLAVEDSLKLRRDVAGHSRGYLEFLKEFIPQARGNRPA